MSGNYMIPCLAFPSALLNRVARREIPENRYIIKEHMSAGGQTGKCSGQRFVSV